MAIKKILVIAACLFLNIFTITAYAIDIDISEPDSEIIIIWTCFGKILEHHNPPLSSSALENCGVSDPKTSPSCLGITSDEYTTIANKCNGDLTKIKCLAGKMNLNLIKTAVCAFADDQSSCYKKLGFNDDQVNQFNSDCSAISVN